MKATKEEIQTWTEETVAGFEYERDMDIARLNVLIVKGHRKGSSAIFSSLSKEEEQEKLALYRKLFPVNPAKLRGLMNLNGRVQKPSRYDDDALLQSPITEQELNLLETLKKYMSAGYRLAFVSPE